jgi:hypothetical protein
MRRPPKSRKADGAHADTVSNLALCQHVDISAQANEAPSARGLRFGKAGRRQQVDVLATFGEGGNLNYSEVLTQGNEAPSARGIRIREGGNLNYSEVSATLRGKAGSPICWNFGADERSAESAGGYVQGKAGSPICWIFGEGERSERSTGATFWERRGLLTR